MHRRQGVSKRVAGGRYAARYAFESLTGSVRVGGTKGSGTLGALALGGALTLGALEMGSLLFGSRLRFLFGSSEAFESEAEMYH